MKKLQALLLILPIFISAKDVEYPIKLTCELGAQVIFINLDKNESTLTFIQNPRMTGYKAHKLKKVKIKDDSINIKLWFGTHPINYNINRYNLKIDELTYGNDGQCHKGFKEYNNKQI